MRTYKHTHTEKNKGFDLGFQEQNQYISSTFCVRNIDVVSVPAMSCVFDLRLKFDQSVSPPLPRIIELNGGQPPLTYKRFQTLISRLDPPEMPVETLSDTLMGRCVTPISEDHGDKYGVPSLEELGEKTNTHTHTHLHLDEYRHGQTLKAFLCVGSRRKTYRPLQKQK